MEPKKVLVIVLFLLFASDVALVATHKNHPVQLAMAIFPFVASIIVAWLSVTKYKRRIRLAQAAAGCHNRAHVSRAATKREVHYFVFSSVLALATLLDAVRIFRRWSFGPSFSMFPTVLEGAFIQYIFVDYLFDWIVPPSP